MLESSQLKQLNVAVAHLSEPYIQQLVPQQQQIGPPGEKATVDSGYDPLPRQIKQCFNMNCAPMPRTVSSLAASKCMETLSRKISKAWYVFSLPHLSKPLVTV